VIGASQFRTLQQRLSAARDGRGSFPVGTAPSPTTIGETSSNYSSTIDPALQQKLDEVESYAHAAYNNMDDEARRRGAAIANEELKLDPPLTGKESWEDMSRIVGGAVGAAALGWIPGGAALGAIAGAWLGVKLEDLISKNIDEIKDWFKGKWSDIEGWVTGTASKIEDGAEAVIDYIGGWF
jgi:hypothetical protein